MTSSQTKRPTEIPGHWVVVGMFAFGIAATATLWIYWKLHIGPFLPLQQAIAAEFDDSRPRVEGGRQKMHEQSPPILRVTIRVDFDPTQSGARAEDFAGQVAAFAGKHHDLSGYELLEIHLFRPEPEKEIKQRSVQLKVAELDPWIGPE